MSGVPLISQARPRTAGSGGSNGSLAFHDIEPHQQQQQQQHPVRRFGSHSRHNSTSDHVERRSSHGNGNGAGAAPAYNPYGFTQPAPRITSSSSPQSLAGGRGSLKRPHEKMDLATDSDEEDEAEGSAIQSDRKKMPGVKRACNECRQQKLKCDVITDPTYTACERCRRLKLQCKIDSNFKRIGKRSRNAEMEREIENLKNQLAQQQLLFQQQQQQPTAVSRAPLIKTEPTAGAILTTATPLHASPPMDTFMGSEDHAVASLMDLASGQNGGTFMRSPNARLLMTRRLGDVQLGQEQVQHLFQTYFTFYHPFLPILDPKKTPDDFFDIYPLLFWIIVSVAARRYTKIPNLLATLSPPLTRLLWDQVADVPQTHFFVKALCLMCMWPLPVNSTSTDPTFVLSGLNMQVAMQIGLHRPSHVQDFSKFKEELFEDELRDRVRTWASCNAVAQRVATGYGQLPSTHYDWTLSPSGDYERGYVLPKDASNRLLIERFCSRVTDALYRNLTDRFGLTTDAQRSTLTRMLTADYQDCARRLVEPDAFSFLYLGAAGLHFRLSILFASPDSLDYNSGLLALWEATTEFLECAFKLETVDGNLLCYSTGYILQMIIAAGFTLLKLLNSFFATFIDLAYGRKLFTETIRAIRAISVTKNDLPSRLAEVLTQLWKGSGAGNSNGTQPSSRSHTLENSLQLKVKCRMSMSVVFDSVWRWREEFQAKGHGNLEAALKNPTNPDSNADPASTTGGSTPAATNTDTDVALVPSLGSGLHSGTPDGFGTGEGYNEIFDPLNWMFDGFVQFPYGLAGVDDEVH